MTTFLGLPPTAPFCIELKAPEQPAEQAHSRRRNFRRCLACREHRPIQEFDRMENGRSRQRCRECEKAGRPRLGRVPKIEAGPCSQCGKSFVVLSEHDKRRRKTCGYTCADKSRRKPRTCSRCNKTKPRDEFERNALTKWCRTYCKECQSQSDKRGGYNRNAAWARPTLARIMQNAKARTAAHGRIWKTTVGKARALYCGGCKLCGDPVSSFQQADFSVDSTPDVLMALCSYCSSVLRSRRFSDVLLLAHRIARHCPLEESKNAKANAGRNPNS